MRTALNAEDWLWVLGIGIGFGSSKIRIGASQHIPTHLPQPTSHLHPPRQSVMVDIESLTLGYPPMSWAQIMNVCNTPGVLSHI